MRATEELDENGEARGPKRYRRRFDFLKRRRRHLFAALEREFARARAEDPALAEYKTLADAARVLRGPPDDPAKIALTEALLLAVRQGHPALADLLVFGYLPMLVYLLRFGSTRIDDQDLRESMALQAFTESIADYRGLLANPCDFLYRATLRRLRRAVRLYQREQSRIDLVDDKELDRAQGTWWEGKLSAEQASIGVRASLAEDAEELTALLRSEVGRRMPRDRLELVEATLLRGEDIASYVKRNFPEQSKKERERIYGRLQRQRNRTVHALRELLAPWRAEVFGTDDPAGRTSDRLDPISVPRPAPPGPSAPTAPNLQAPRAPSHLTVAPGRSAEVAATVPASRWP